MQKASHGKWKSMGISTTSLDLDWALGRLERIMGDFIQAAEALQSILENKRDILVDSNTEELSPLIEKEGSALRRLETLEGERLALTAEITSSLGLAEDSGLSDILPSLGLRDGHPLISLAGDLREHLTHLRELNGTNAVLAQGLARYVEQVLRMLTTTSDLNNYSHSGKVDYEGERRSLLDRRA